MSTAKTGKGGGVYIDLVARADAGSLGYMLNPEGHDLIITRSVLYIETDTSDAGTTLNIGVGATATTDNASLGSALAIDGTAGTAFQGFDHADAKDALVIWPAAEYVTTTSSAAATAFAGKLYIEYLHVT